MLGPYRIIEQVGQGGMATVYKAYHAAMDRYAAIKVLPRQLAENPEFMGRFQQEARTIANLEHARILPVYDYGESDGTTYLVMRYLDAGTLKDRMKAGSLPLADVDRLFTQLAEALEYAHKRGVVHRDLKPSNVLVDTQGDLFLTDFGIAKLLESGGAQFTTTGAMMGTPAYMSPEQAQGEKVDQRTDIYSLGIMLYELVTGRVPFEAETPLAVVLKQINALLPPPSSLKPDIAPGIERLLLKALAKDPEARFATIGEFLAAWKTALSEASTVRATAPDPLEIKAAAPTVISTPAPAREPETVTAEPRPISPGAPAETTSAPQRKLPLGPILGGVAVLAVILVGAIVIIPRLRGGDNEPRATATAEQSAAATSGPQATSEPPTAEPAATPLPPSPPADFTWQSWTAANRVRTVFVKGGELYAAGPGGITVWNTADGTVLRRYTTGDGLPHPNIFSVWVDDDGTLWAATEGGLGRLNPGESDWTVYGPDDGLDSQLVTSVVRAGELLIVGSQYSDREGSGLNLFDGQSWQAAPNFPSVHQDLALEAGKLSTFVNVILPAPDGLLWVGTSVGLGRYERDSQTWTRYTTDDGLPDNNIFSLYVDQAGVLLVGTGVGAARFDGQAFQTTEQGPPYGVYGITQDQEGRYYFSGGGGIWRFDPDQANWDEFSTQTGALTVYELTGAAAGEDGVLYFGSDGAGVWRYAEGEFTAWYEPASTVVASLGAILPAPDGGELWFIEAYGSYIDRFNFAQNAWEPFTENPCDCYPMTVDAGGNLWGWRYQEGFVILAPDGNLSQVSADQGLPVEYEVRSVAPLADGTAWLGTYGQGVARYEGGQITEILTAENTGFASDFARTVFLASDGSLWVSTDGSVSRRTPDGTWEHFREGDVFDGDNFDYAADFAEDEQGGIWVATRGAWVYRYADGKWTQFVGGRAGVALPSPYVNAVAVAPDGSLWFATDGGAARFDGNAWTAYKVQDGLINNYIYDVYVEPSGAVWFATSGGVTRWGP